MRKWYHIISLVQEAGHKLNIWVFIVKYYDVLLQIKNICHKSILHSCYDSDPVIINKIINYNRPKEVHVTKAFGITVAWNMSMPGTQNLKYISINQKGFLNVYSKD